MFAIDHAATALLVKRRYPSVPMTPLLVSVQAMELAWVGLNYLGIERTTTEATVRSVADIHLVYMPYSHSVGTAVSAAVLAWLIIEKGFGRAALGRAIGLGIVSHLILDLAVHGHDIALWPGLPTPKLGLGLYDAAPFAAFTVEMVYGVFCWYVYRGGPGLLALICLGNLANLSFFSPAIAGPEQYLAGRPMLAVTLVFVQIVVTLVLVGVLARRNIAPSRTLWHQAGGAGTQHRQRPGASSGTTGRRKCSTSRHGIGTRRASNRARTADLTPAARFHTAWTDPMRAAASLAVTLRLA